MNLTVLVKENHNVLFLQSDVLDIRASRYCYFSFGVFIAVFCCASSIMGSSSTRIPTTNATHGSLCALAVFQHFSNLGLLANLCPISVLCFGIL